MEAKTLKCGCVVGQYWCSKHDIYTGNTPPWGAGSRRSKQSARVYNEEIDNPDIEYRKPDCCSCHLGAPCGYCTQDMDKDI